jgi:hypothetical protein
MSTPYAPQPAPHTAPVPPLDLTPAGPAAPRKRRFPMWARFVAVGVGGLILGAAMAGGDSSTPSAAAPAATVTAPADTAALASMTAERDAAVKRADTAEAAIAQRDADAAAADAAAAAPAGLVDGMYVVGTDIEPGRYSMVGTSAFGYVDQQNGDDYLAQEVAGSGERIVVDIANVPGSVVSFRSVTEITKIG